MKLLTLCGILASCLAAAYSQTAPAALSFEVASIKPAGPLNRQAILSGQQMLGRKLDKARVEYAFVSPGELISMAYGVKSYQVAGPDWLQGAGAQRFNIQAKLPEGATEAQIPQMLQSLLRERFGLAFHRENKERGIFELTVAKSGARLKPSDSSESGDAEDASQGMQLSGNVEDGKGLVVKGGPFSSSPMRVTPDLNGQGLHLDMASLSMSRLAELLSRVVDRPVIDASGLKGEYQVSLDLPMSAAMTMAGLGGRLQDADSPSALLESLGKLGLKLESRKGVVESLVIDHLERIPTEN